MNKKSDVFRDAHREMQELKHHIDAHKTWDGVILSLSIATSLGILGAMISAHDRFHARRTRMAMQNTRGK